jgi:hypothetical protein
MLGMIIFGDDANWLRVFKNKELRRIFGPKRDEVTGVWRKVHNEEFRDLYSSPSIIRIITSRRMKWTGQVARMGKRVMHIDQVQGFRLVHATGCKQPT